MQVDDEMLMAFADGELEGELRKRFGEALLADPMLRRKFEAQKRLRATVSAHYAPILREPIPDRLIALLNQEKDDDSLSSAAGKRRWTPSWESLTAIAASLVIGFFAGQMLDLSREPTTRADIALASVEGDLARTLETELASEQRRNEGAEVGVTFEASDGRLCRTFSGADLTGIACRSEKDWQLVLAAPGAPASGEYRQAGSDAAIMAAAQEMMIGEPLGPKAERQAREAGWAAP